MRKKRKDKRLIGTINKCQYCGKDFYPWRPSNKFCSRECMVLGRPGPTRKKKRVTYICEGCGEKFEARSSRERKFCSQKCKSKYQINGLKGRKNPNWKGGITKTKSGTTGPARYYRKGSYYERKTKKFYEKLGYYVVRSTASRGQIDLVAIGEEDIRIIQVKSGKTFVSKKTKEEFKTIEAPPCCIKEWWTWKERQEPRIERWEMRYDKKRYKPKTKCECGGYIYVQPVYACFRKASGNSEIIKGLEGKCTRCGKVQDILEEK